MHLFIPRPLITVHLHRMYLCRPSLIFSLQGTIYHCNSPAVSTATLSIGKYLCNPSLSVYSSTNGLATVKKIRSDISSLVKRSVPYFVATGASSRSSCRACGYTFKKEELRVKTLLIRSLNNVPCMINMCMNMRCIRGGSARYASWVRSSEIFCQFI